jgi:hypothetical protein
MPTVTAGEVGIAPKEANSVTRECRPLRRAHLEGRDTAARTTSLERTETIEKSAHRTKTAGSRLRHGERGVSPGALAAGVIIGLAGLQFIRTFYGNPITLDAGWVMVVVGVAFLVLGAVTNLGENWGGGGGNIGRSGGGMRGEPRGSGYSGYRDFDGGYHNRNGP